MGEEVQMPRKGRGGRLQKRDPEKALVVHLMRDHGLPDLIEQGWSYMTQRDEHFYYHETNTPQLAAHRNHPIKARYVPPDKRVGPSEPPG